MRFDDGRFGEAAGFLGFGFGDAGGFGNVGIRKAVGLRSGSRAGGLGFELEFPSVSQRFDFVAFGVGRFLDVRFQFALFAQDFLLLQFDLLLLFDDADLNLFGFDQLAGLIFLEIVGEIGFGLFEIH